MPIWDYFYDWLDLLTPAKESKFEKVVKYTQNHRDSLHTYLQDGRCELSNNAESKKLCHWKKEFSVSHIRRRSKSEQYHIQSGRDCKSRHLNLFQYLYKFSLYILCELPEKVDLNAKSVKKASNINELCIFYCANLIDIETITMKNT